MDSSIWIAAILEIRGIPRRRRSSDRTRARTGSRALRFFAICPPNQWRSSRASDPSAAARGLMVAQPRRAGLFLDKGLGSADLGGIIGKWDAYGRGGSRS